MLFQLFGDSQWVQSARISIPYAWPRDFFQISRLEMHYSLRCTRLRLRRSCIRVQAQFDRFSRRRLAAQANLNQQVNQPCSAHWYWVHFCEITDHPRQRHQAAAVRRFRCRSASAGAKASPFSAPGRLIKRSEPGTQSMRRQPGSISASSQLANTITKCDADPSRASPTEIHLFQLILHPSTANLVLNLTISPWPIQIAPPCSPMESPRQALVQMSGSSPRLNGSSLQA